MKEPLPRIPRDPEDDHSERAVRSRLALIEAHIGRAMPHLAGRPVDPGEARGKIENLVGFAQVPVGIAGPLAVDTSAGWRQVYVPLATTEGALVASYARGMKVLLGAGGARSRVLRESLTQHPILLYRDAESARSAALRLPEAWREMQRLTGSITSHGRLLSVEPEQVGRRLILCFSFATGDAIGINMAAHATELCARAFMESSGAEARYVHGEDVEKRANARALIEGRGRSVVCDVTIPRGVLREVLRVTPEDLVAIQRSYAVGFARLGTQNHLVQAANGLAALFLACGQDVAYLTESAIGFLDLEATDAGDLHAAATLPCLLVGTVGGGTGQGTAAECLDLLGVRGTGGGNVFAEIAAAVVLAGDLSLTASFCTHEFVAAHERLGRNRPLGSSMDC